VQDAVSQISPAHASATNLLSSLDREEVEKLAQVSITYGVCLQHVGRTPLVLPLQVEAFAVREQMTLSIPSLIEPTPFDCGVSGLEIAWWPRSTTRSLSWATLMGGMLRLTP
jgi:hypothetical protein